MAKPFHILVDGGVFFDIGISLRDVRFRLVVIVVGNEVLNCVIRQEGAEFVGQLCCQCLVRSHDQGGALHLFDEPGSGSRFSGTRCPHQHRVPIATVNSASEFCNCGRLVAGGLERTLDTEGLGRAEDLADRPVTGLGEVRVFGCEGHAVSFHA